MDKVRLVLFFILYLFVQSRLVCRELKKGEIDFSIQSITSYADTPIEKVYYEIPSNQLQYIVNNDSFVTTYRISAIIYDKKGNQITGDVWERKFVCSRYEETLSETLYIRDKVEIKLSEGEYSLKVLVKDLNSTKRGSIKTDIKVSKLTGRLYISDILFLKDNRMNVGKRYSSEDATLQFLFDIYNPDSEDLSIEAFIEDEKKQSILKKEIMALDVSTVKSIDIHGLKGGEYTLLIAVSSSNDTVTRTYTFFIESPPFFSDEEYFDLISVLEYIASFEDMKKLKEAPPEKREETLKEFWKTKDPTPSTEANEVKDEYLRRVRYANKHFSYIFKKGAKTDRGRIYIKYGEPDEVERHPYEINTMPYEVWYYYTRKLKFVFVDEHGWGEYILVSPKYMR